MNTPIPKPSRDCKHGRLARSCEICELEREVVRLQNIETTCQNLGQELYEAKQQCETLTQAILSKEAGKVIEWEQCEKERDQAIKERDEAIEKLKSASVPICIGEPIITILARDGCWKNTDNRAVIAADDLFQRNPYDELKQLRMVCDAFEDCMTHNGITLEVLQGCMFESQATGEDVSALYAETLAAYNSLPHRTALSAKSPDKTLSKQ